MPFLPFAFSLSFYLALSVCVYCFRYRSTMFFYTTYPTFCHFFYNIFVVCHSFLCAFFFPMHVLNRPNFLRLNSPNTMIDHGFGMLCVFQVTYFNGIPSFTYTYKKRIVFVSTVQHNVVKISQFILIQC